MPPLDSLTHRQWSSDGRFIVYQGLDLKAKWDVWVLHLHGAPRKPEPFMHSEFKEIQCQLSRDSRWKAYTSDEIGHREGYVRPFPNGDRVWPISTLAARRQGATLP